MGTRIVFAGGNEVEVEEAFDDVKRDMQESGAGNRLIECHPRGIDAPIYVNRASVAYIATGRPGQGKAFLEAWKSEIEARSA